MVSTHLGLQPYLSDTAEVPKFSGCPFLPSVLTTPRHNPGFYTELSLSFLKSVNPLSPHCLGGDPRPVNECFLKTEDKHP